MIIFCEAWSINTPLQTLQPTATPAKIMYDLSLSHHQPGVHKYLPRVIIYSPL